MKTKSTTKNKFQSWAPIWFLALLFALPSCFEISCIKLTGCELFANDADLPDRIGDGVESIDQSIDFTDLVGPADVFEELTDLVTF